MAIHTAAINAEKGKTGSSNIAGTNR